MPPDNSSATLLQHPKVVGINCHYSSNFVIIQQSYIEYYESLDLGILPRMLLTYRHRTLTGLFNSVGLFTSLTKRKSPSLGKDQGSSGHGQVSVTGQYSSVRSISFDTVFFG